MDSENLDLLYNSLLTSYVKVIFIISSLLILVCISGNCCMLWKVVGSLIPHGYLSAIQVMSFSLMGSYIT